MKTLMNRWEVDLLNFWNACIISNLFTVDKYILFWFIGSISC